MLVACLVMATDAGIKLCKDEVGERNCFQKLNSSQVIMIWKLGNPTALLVLFVIISHYSEMVLTKSLNHFGSHISVTSTKLCLKKECCFNINQKGFQK